MISIGAMTIDLYDGAAKLWQQTPALRVSLAFDTRERVAAYLERNPGISTAALDGDRVVGTVLCGHDGRRGSLYHVAVAPGYRGRGVARTMIGRSLARLKAVGIDTSFVSVHLDDEAALEFWQGMGWKLVPNVGYCYRESH